MTNQATSFFPLISFGIKFDPADKDEHPIFVDALKALEGLDDDLKKLFIDNIGEGQNKWDEYVKSAKGDLIRREIRGPLLENIVASNPNISEAYVAAQSVFIADEMTANFFNAQKDAIAEHLMSTAPRSSAE